MFRAEAWGAWVLASLLPLLLTKNPIYLLLAIFVVGIVYMRLGRSSPTGRQWSLLLRLGLALGLFSVAFNVLFVRVGATQIARLPALRVTLGGALIQIGGVVTLESLIYGLSQALSLAGILVTLATFNALADHYELLRSTPRFLYQSAIVVSIAVTFVPQMMAVQGEIREAQALRGHRFRTLRDLPPLFVALLAEGLERSITLAESMSARGFGSQAERPLPPRSVLQIIIALALFVVMGGAAALAYPPTSTAGALLLAAGGGMLAAVLWSINQGVRRSRYRRGVWRRADSLIAGASLLSLVIWLGVWFYDRSALIFYPYPQLTWPPVQPLIGLAILLSLAPVCAHHDPRTSHDG